MDIRGSGHSIAFPKPLHGSGPNPCEAAPKAPSLSADPSPVDVPAAKPEAESATSTGFFSKITSNDFLHASPNKLQKYIDHSNQSGSILSAFRSSLRGT